MKRRLTEDFSKYYFSFGCSGPQETNNTVIRKNIGIIIQESSHTNVFSLSARQRAKHADVVYNTFALNPDGRKSPAERSGLKHLLRSTMNFQVKHVMISGMWSDMKKKKSLADGS